MKKLILILTLFVSVTVTFGQSLGYSNSEYLLLMSGFGGTINSPLVIRNSGYQTTLASSTAEGLSGVDLRIGLNETLRAMVLVDAGDLDTDLGIVPEVHPTFYIFDDDVSHFTAMYQKAAVFWLDNSEKGTSAQMFFQTDKFFQFNTFTGASSGNMFYIQATAGARLTETNGRQAGLYIAPRIGQSGSAAYDGLLIDIIDENSIGSGATGDGNNIANFAIEGVSKWRLDRTGNLVTIDSLVSHRERSWVADDGEILLATGKAGWGFAMIGDNQEYAHFVFTAAGAVTLLTDVSGNVVNTDTDAKFCIYDAGSGIAIKNRLAAPLTIMIDVKYADPTP